MSSTTLPSNFSQPSSLQTNAQIDLNNTAITTVCNYVCSTEVKLLAGEYLRDGISTFHRGDMRGFIDAFGLSVAFANTVNSKDPTVRALFATYTNQATFVAEVKNGQDTVTTARLDTLATFILWSMSPAYVSLNSDVLTQLQSLVKLGYTTENVPNPSQNVNVFNSVAEIASACALSNGDTNTSGALEFFTGPSTWGAGNNYPNLVLPFATASDAQASFTLVIKGINSNMSYTAGTSWVTTGTTTSVTPSVGSSLGTSARTQLQLLTAYNNFVRTRLVTINEAHPIGMSTYMNEKALASYYTPEYYGERKSLGRKFTSGGVFVPGFAFDAVLDAYYNVTNPNTAQANISNTGFTPPTAPSSGSSPYYNFIAYCKQAGIPLTILPGFGNVSESYKTNGGIGVLDYLRSAANTATPAAGGPTNVVTITSQILKDLDYIYDGAIKNAAFSDRVRLLQTTSANGVVSLAIDDLLKVAVPTDGLAAIAGYIGNAKNTDNTRIVTISSTGEFTRATLTLNNATVTNPISQPSLNLLTGVGALLGKEVTATTSAFFTVDNIVTSPQTLEPATTSPAAAAKIRLSSFPESTVSQAYGWLATGAAGAVPAVTPLVSNTVANTLSSFAVGQLTSAKGFTVIPGTTVTKLVRDVATSNGGSPSFTALTAALFTTPATKINAVEYLLALLRETPGTSVSAVNNVLSLPASSDSQWSKGYTPTHLMIYGLGLARTSSDSFDAFNGETAITLGTLNPAWTPLPSSAAGARANYFVRYIPALFTFLATNPGAMSAAFEGASAQDKEELGRGIAQLINAGGAISGKLNIPALIKLFGGNSEFAVNVLNAAPLSVMQQGIFADLVPILQTIGVDVLSKSFGAGTKAAEVSNASNAQIIMSNWALAFTDPIHFPALQQAGFRITDLLTYTRTMTRYSGRGDAQNMGFPTTSVSTTTLSILAFDVLHEKCLEAYGVTEAQVKAIALAQGIILN